MDDEQALLDLFLGVLSKSGYEVSISRHGDEAIELYTSAMKSGRLFDALIIDLCINNGMGGLETIGRLSAIHPGIKAILCSGNVSHPAVWNHSDFGFSGILRKPFTFDELRTEVDRVLK
jgi:DNA-binding NtrC family response regulator